MDIVGMVAKDLQRITKRNNPLTPKQQYVSLGKCWVMVGAKIYNFTPSTSISLHKCPNFPSEISLGMYFHK